MALLIGCGGDEASEPPPAPPEPAPAEDEAVPDGPADDEILVTRGQQDRLVAAFQTTWKRPPTQREFDGLVDNWIREEIAYREAVEMGLDANDMILRRRLRQKFELVAEDIVSLVEPTTEELEQFLADNATDYSQDAVYSLRQVFFSTDLRADAARHDAEQALSMLQADPQLSNPETLGDVAALPYRLVGEPETDVSAQFGRDFAAALRAIEPGRWQGPVRSGYGLHLVMIDDFVPGRAPTLEEVERSVRRDWHTRQRDRAIDALYERLRAEYRIKVETPTRPGSSDS